MTDIGLGEKAKMVLFHDLEISKMVNFNITT